MRKILKTLCTIWLTFAYGIAIIIWVAPYNLVRALDIVGIWYFVGTLVVLAAWWRTNDDFWVGIDLGRLISIVDAWPVYLIAAVFTAEGRRLFFGRQEPPEVGDSPFARQTDQNPYQSPLDF